ncbi:hypothetical protein PMAYCL1PPCAC_14841, partial [Pristionchus mayeri]
IGDVMAQSAVSAEIDQILLEEKREEQGRLKILLLGGSDAGKSTILKQMRILHMNGFSKDEIHSFQKYLRHNVYQVNRRNIFVIMPIFRSVTRSLKCVRTFTRCHPNYSSLPDNAHYYMPKIGALLSPQYVPTPEDILHLRIPTTTVNEINFSFDKATIRLIDVGGQRSYRKKWIHYFDGAVLFRETGIMPFQALEAHETIKPILHEDIIAHAIVKPQKRQNRLRESAVLFGEMLRCKFLLTAAFILFLNKKDLFVKKLSSRPLCERRPQFADPRHSLITTCLLFVYLQRKSKKDSARKIYCHYTCATDTKNVEFVFKAACDIVLQKSLNSSGIQ